MKEIFSFDVQAWDKQGDLQQYFNVKILASSYEYAEKALNRKYKNIYDFVYND